MLSRHRAHGEIAKFGLTGLALVLFALVVNLVFWLGLIFGALWGLDHFGVI